MKKVKSIHNFLIRTTIAMILFFFFCILIDNDILSLNKVNTSIIDFAYFRSKTNFLLGNILNKKDKFVSSEKIKYKSIDEYNSSYKLEVDSNYVVKSLKKGVVVFIGNKENLGSTVVINGDDGENIWYSNLENINVYLYDYIPEGTILGSSIGTNIYLTFEKNNQYDTYEKYL